MGSISTLKEKKESLYEPGVVEVSKISRLVEGP